MEYLMLWSRGSCRGTLSPEAKPQRHGGKSAQRERRPQPRPPTPSGKAGGANEQQLWLSGGGVECDSGQTLSLIRAAPREREGTDPANRGGAAAEEWCSSLCGSSRSGAAVCVAVREGKASRQGAAPPSWLLK